MHELALSTMWGLGRFQNLAEFLDAARAIGFTRIELNHGVDSRMLKGLDWNGLHVPSIHEPCPADISTGNLKKHNWLISAPGEEERNAGVAAIKKSIDLACEMGARIVIVHPGRVDMETAVDTNQRLWYRAGKSNTAEYAALTEQFTQSRAARAARNMESVCRSLKELAEYAGKRRIKLGLENRYHYFEIPLPDELESLLNLGYDDVIGYWHDLGHAQVLEHLGFGTHKEWLERFGSRIIGIHLHDVIGIDDHRAAGLGVIDWSMVARYIPSRVPWTCEFQNDNSPDQVASGVRFLIDHGWA